ncbi:MAG TPA: glycosyl hydrolase [Methylibium sp.]
MNSYRILKAQALICALAAATCLSAAAGEAAWPGFVYSPYKDITIGLDAGTHRISPLRAIDADTPAAAAPTTLTLAFARGECGEENWAGHDAQAFADTNVAELVRADIDYVVSTGGQGNVFNCGSDAGMERFIARYASSHLIGFDLDIESGQTSEQIAALVRRVKAAQARHPKLRFSFTLPTFAASDGSGASLNALGQRVLQSIRRHGLKAYTINLMVMDYGAASPSACVVAAGRCDMGRSAIQAAHNLHTRYGLPFSQIELTPMIGVNDVKENVFTLDDARLVAKFVRENKLAGLHFWSLDRDAPCPGDATEVSDRCSSMLAQPRGAYAQTFMEALR